MIYTVTFNPSLDYVVQVEELHLGEINRTKKEGIFPGGKGNNVSVMLSNLGIKSKALGFIAGFTGRHLEQMLEDYGCETDYIKLERGLTRINVKIHGKEESEINGQGPEIKAEDLQKLFEKLEELQRGDILVLAGSIPGTLPADIYERIMKKLQSKGIRIVVDATKDLLWNVLPYHPFLIKPNHHELGEMFGVELDNEEKIITYAKKLQEQGATNVLISMAGAGAILLTEAGQIYRGDAPKGTVINSVGAGDSMVAGFLTGYLNTGNYEKAFHLGIASGSASAFVSWLAKKEEVTALLNEPKETFGL